MNCPNCNAMLSCGCQKKLASDGTVVCASCINQYELNLQQIKIANERALKLN